MTEHIVFVHGAWVGPSCWTRFRERFEARGYSTSAPSWPFDDRPVEALRAAPAPELARIGVREIVDHYAAIVSRLPTPPILIGHSFGGLFVQMLLDRGLGAAGIAIDSAPPKGVLPAWSAIRAGSHVLRKFAGWRRVLTITYEDFRWGFVHTLSETEARATYEEHVIPTPGRPFWQAALNLFGSALRVDYRNDRRAPLLLVAGGADRTVTAGMNRKNHRNYRHARAVTDFHEFPGRSHWIIAQPGWEEVADHAMTWLDERALAARAAGEPTRPA